MKRLFTFFAALAMLVSMWAQQPVFTVVYATSSDGFVNVRKSPSSKAPIIEKLYASFHGHGDGVLRKQGDTWSRISVYDVTGWVSTKYIGTQTWYTGQGQSMIVAAKDQTKIYGENFADEVELPLFTTVEKGTIIADEYSEDDNYYILETAHDYFFIKKSDVEVVKVR